LGLFQASYLAFFILLMAFTRTAKAGVLDLMNVQLRCNQVQLFLGIFNEKSNKAYSIYTWVLHGSWFMGVNVDNYVNP